MSLRPQERQDRIATYVLEHGSVSVERLMQDLGVSRMTVHRDLDELEALGILRKVRGGATAERSSLFESDVRYRVRSAVREKEALAAVASQMVEPGQSIMIDESTTMLPLARRLGGLEQPLTLITNFLPVIQQLSGRRGIRLIALGGEYSSHYDAFRGLICDQTIGSLRADVAFLSPSAVSGVDVFHQDQGIVATKRAMLTSAARRVLLVDHHKLGRTALHHLATLHEFDTVVVDGEAEPRQLAALRESHADVRVAPLLDGR